MRRFLPVFVLLLGYAVTVPVLWLCTEVLGLSFLFGPLAFLLSAAAQVAAVQAAGFEVRWRLLWLLPVAAALLNPGWYLTTAIYALVLAVTLSGPWCLRLAVAVVLPVALFGLGFGVVWVLASNLFTGGGTVALVSILAGYLVLLGVPLGIIQARFNAHMTQRT